VQYDGVLRVYLDQNQWIYLALAATGNERGKQFHDALAMCRAGVAAGTVSFPLDMYRYWETSKRSNDRSRFDVVNVMRELSQQHTMALPFGLLDREIDLALQRRFGRPEQPRQQQVFGSGIRHITEGRLRWPELDLNSLPDAGPSLPSALRAQLQAAVDAAVEVGLLHAGPNDYRALGFEHAASDHARRFVDFENRVSAEIAKHRLTGYDIDLAVIGTDFRDIRPPLSEALERIGMSYDEFTADLSIRQLVEFLDDLPTRYVTNIMRAAKHRQAQQRWEPNDFVDILALPVAAVYCDVVVTERQWAHRLRQGKVTERYGTVLLSSAASLPDVLVAASP
jgi:hypothetical protein